MSSKKHLRHFTDRSVWQMHLLSIGSLLFCLLVLGGVALLHIGVDSLHRSLGEQIGFNVELPQKTTLSENQRLQAMLVAKPYVHSVELVSADSALKQLQAELGEDPVILLGYNPLSAMLKVQLRSEYLMGDSLDIVEQELKTLLPDLSLDHKREMMDDLRSKAHNAELVLVVVALALLVFALLQMRNTMYMALMNERADIRTLRLVGASSWFVSRPFVIRAFWSGLLATCLALGGLFAGAYLLYSEFDFPLEVLSLRSYRFMCEGGVFLFVGLVIPSILAWRISNHFIHIDETSLPRR